MSDTPSYLRYTKTHEWVQVDGDVATIDITSHAQSLLGDLVYVELPEIGDVVERGKECVVVESVKAAADVYAPVSGEVIAVNEDLSGMPEQINESPYEQGWIAKIRVAHPGEMDSLLSADDYSQTIE